MKKVHSYTTTVISPKTITIIVAFILMTYDGKSQKLPEGFVYLDNHIENIEIDLRYFSEDNFIGDTINGYHNSKCIITLKAANALKNVQADLSKLGLGLKIFDTYRPQRAVDHFINWGNHPNDTLMKREYYPELNKSELFEKGYISRRSGHSRGSTVDLTIIHLKGDDQGKELDMATPWDFFGKLSWPGNTTVTNEQFDNRMLLQTLMIKHGFKPLKEEWWHFTLVDEPFPDTYFDFPVK